MTYSTTSSFQEAALYHHCTIDPWTVSSYFRPMPPISRLSAYPSRFPLLHATLAFTTIPHCLNIDGARFPVPFTTPSLHPFVALAPCPHSSRHRPCIGSAHTHTRPMPAHSHKPRHAHHLSPRSHAHLFIHIGSFLFSSGSFSPGHISSRLLSYSYPRSAVVVSFSPQGCGRIDGRSRPARSVLVLVLSRIPYVSLGTFYFAHTGYPLSI